MGVFMGAHGVGLMGWGSWGGVQWVRSMGAPSLRRSTPTVREDDANEL
jgi:hypothetical protein